MIHYKRYEICRKIQAKNKVKQWKNTLVKREFRERLRSLMHENHHYNLEQAQQHHKQAQSPVTACQSPHQSKPMR